MIGTEDWKLEKNENQSTGLVNYKRLRVRCLFIFTRFFTVSNSWSRIALNSDVCEPDKVSEKILYKYLEMKNIFLTFFFWKSELAGFLCKRRKVGEKRVGQLYWHENWGLVFQTFTLLKIPYSGFFNFSEIVSFYLVYW